MAQFEEPSGSGEGSLVHLLLSMRPSSELDPFGFQLFRDSFWARFEQVYGSNLVIWAHARHGLWCLCSSL